MVSYNFFRRFYVRNNLFNLGFSFLEGNIVILEIYLIIFCILKRKLLKYDNNFEEFFSILSYGTEEYIEKTRDLLNASVINNIDRDNIEKYKKK